MSTIKLSHFFFFLFFVTFSIHSYAQVQRTITLSCQDNQLTDDNINSVCNFGQPSDISNEEFTVDLPKAGIAIFEGKFETPGLGYIDIVSIDYESGVNIFRDRHLRGGGNSANDGRIRGVVKRGNVGDVLKYAITFDAYDSNGNFIGRFTIDPKIKIIQ